MLRGIAPTRLRLATAWQAERGGYSLREMAQQHGPFEYFNRLLGDGILIDAEDDAVRNLGQRGGESGFWPWSSFAQPFASILRTTRNLALPLIIRS